MPQSDVFLKGPYKVDFRHPWPPAEERRVAGRQARARVTRGGLGAWAAADEVRDPVEIVSRVAAWRQPRLMPIRVARMAVSPFSFYRGGATLMAEDLARSPNTGLDVQLCGDAHLANFGLYASPERSLVFDINDFDETSQGPWEWDLKRLVTSFVLAARENGEGKRAEEAVRAAVSGYLMALDEMAGLGWLERRYRLLPAETPAAANVQWSRKVTLATQAVVDKAKGRTQQWTVAKYTERDGGEPRLRVAPPLISAVSRRTKATVTAALRRYLESLSVERRAYLAAYHVVDVAHKVVGVGSVGTLDYIVLLVGDGGEDELLLQVKEAEASSIRQALGAPSVLGHGERVVVGTWVSQGVSDPFLGWTDLRGRSFYVRQLKDMKGGVDPAALRGSLLPAYGRRCGFALGLAHSRAGDPDPILGYAGKGAALADAMWAWASAYADQTERDYARFMAAVGDGRLVAADPVVAGVAKPAKPAKPAAKKAAQPAAKNAAKRGAPKR